MKTTLGFLLLSASLWGPCMEPENPTIPETSGPQPDHTVQWKKSDGGNGHFYTAVYTPKGINWADAQAYAIAHGGYLATVTTANENEFVFKLATDPKYWQLGQDTNAAPWLGGIKVSDEAGEHWEWINHEGPFTYTRWYTGSSEPNNYRGHENRLQYNWEMPTADWNDSPTEDMPHGFIMEMEHPPPTPAVKTSPPLPYLAWFIAAAVTIMATVLLARWIAKRQREESGASPT